MPKGRIFEEAVRLLRLSGLPMPKTAELSRKLMLDLPSFNLSFILAKPVDVATYVEYGAADVGVVGKDILLEDKRDVYELLDLGIGACRLSLIGLPEARREHLMVPRVATKYPRVASHYFRQKGQQVEVVKLNGSIELAPIVGLADRVVDIIETGTTMRENGLVELETIAPVTSRFIANRGSFRMKHQAISALVDRFKTAIAGKEEGEA
jgi:ATP phosphoribosyltransferase